MQPHRRRESLDPSEVCTLKRQRTDSELLEFVIQAANEGNVAEDHPIAESSSIAGNQANAGVSRPTHVCEICGRVFETKPRLKRHYITKHHGDKPYECSTCGERFPRKDYLARHLASYHSSASTTNPPEFLCTYPGCGREFRERALLNRHLESHSVNPSFVCSIENCGKHFARKEYLQDHLRTHSGEKRFECPLCPLRFLHKSSLGTHMRRKHAKLDDDAKCPDCGQQFDNPSQRDKHLIEHRGPLPYRCEHCGHRSRLLTGHTVHEAKCPARAAVQPPERQNVEVPLQWPPGMLQLQWICQQQQFQQQLCSQSQCGSVEIPGWFNPNRGDES